MKNIFSANLTKYTIAILGLLTLGALYATTLPVLFHQSIRLDESQSLWIATKPLASILKFTAQDVHVPLYSLLLHFVTQIFGSDITVARSLSLIFFVLTIPVLYLLALEASTKRVAILTTTLYVLSPFILWYSFEARMYTLLIFASTITQLFFLRFMRSKGREGKLGLLLSMLIGVYSHYFFLLVVATQGLYVLGVTIAQTNIQRQANKGAWWQAFRQSAGPLWRYSGIAAISVATLVPWLAYVISNGSASNTQPLIAEPSSFNLLQTFVNFVFGFQSLGVQSALVALWPLAIVLLFFAFTLKRTVPLNQLTYFVLASFLPVILVFTLSFIRPVFLSRYLIFTAPTLFLVLSWMLLNFSRKISIVATSLLIATMLGLLVHQNTSAATPVKEDYRDAVAYVSQQATPFDIVAVSAPFTIYPIEYQYTGPARITTIPEWNRYTQGAIPAFNEQNMAKQLTIMQKTYQKLYVILSYNQGYEQKIQQYLDNHYALDREQTYSTDLQVRVYTLRYN